MTGLAGVVRSGQRLGADPTRVVTQLFVPGQEGFGPHDSRAQAVVDRLLALEEGEVAECLADVVARFGTRHRDLTATFHHHADLLADRCHLRELSAARRLLLGATFTSEYAIEGAALCNPSVVANPDQDGTAAGSLRVVLSTRSVGEGHVSSLGFRTGTVDSDGAVRIDPAPAWATTGRVGGTLLSAAAIRMEVHRRGGASENVDYVLDPLGPQFTRSVLEERLGSLAEHPHTRHHGQDTAALLWSIADRTYTVTFPEATVLAERVLRPAMGAEVHGIEDARFVRFVHDDGSVTYYATYTAYDGADISQQLLRTDDFCSFTSSPLVGEAAANKGLALFPRRIGGRYAALTRADRETNGVSFSDDPQVWEGRTTVQVPARPWELLQLGNCGPPIETPAGWLVLTHGVGPMRTYCIGAILLDLDDPTVVIGQLRQPLLAPAAEEQDGYVPNVVYSCGALVHADTLVLPYGISDAAIGIATIGLPGLIEDCLRG